MSPHERIADLEKDRHQLGEQLQQVLMERDAYKRWKCDADAELADLKRQLAKVESQRDFWYEACQEDELSKLNDEIDDLKRQLAEARERADRWGEWRDKAGSYERQLVCISKVLGGKDARHVREGFEPSIAGLVEQQLTDLREQNAKLRDGLVALGLAAGEQKRRGEPIVHDAIIDVVKFALRETSDESEAKDE